MASPQLKTYTNSLLKPSHYTFAVPPNLYKVNFGVVYEKSVGVSMEIRYFMF